MRIGHIALYARDLENMKAFYEEFFGAVANAKYHNPKTGLQTYFLTFEGGAKLELMTRPDVAENNAEPYRLGYAHLCFQLDAKEQVDALTARLAGAGYRVASGPRTTGDGYYESCVLDPENNPVEICA